jgi:hypothetical protein
MIEMEVKTHAATQWFTSVVPPPQSLDDQLYFLSGKSCRLYTTSMNAAGKMIIHRHLDDILIIEKKEIR